MNKKSRHYCCVGEKLNIKVGWLLSKLCCLDMSLTFVAKMGEVFRGPGFSSRLPKNDEKTFFQCSHSLCKIYFQWPKVGYRTKIAPSWPTFLLPFLCKPKVSKLFLAKMHFGQNVRWWGNQFHFRKYCALRINPRQDWMRLFCDFQIRYRVKQKICYPVDKIQIFLQIIFLGYF